MKPCAEVEPLLYLYAELTASEKRQADQHIAACKACSVLFKSLQENHVWLQRAAEVQVVPPHAGRLTSNIMAAIAKPEKPPVFWLQNMFLKYTLMATSLVLIIFFGAEQLSPAERVYKRMPEAKTVTLNSSSFLKAVVDQGGKNQRHKPSLYACAKSGSCENEIIKNFKLKKSS